MSHEHDHHSSRPTLRTKRVFTTFAEAKYYLPVIKRKHLRDRRYFLVIPCGGQFCLGTRDIVPKDARRSP